MSNRTPIAIVTEFADPSEVSLVYADPPPSDSLGEFEDSDVLDLIEQEHCFVSRDGTHSYLNGGMRCCYCGTAHPSARGACGRVR